MVDLPEYSRNALQGNLLADRIAVSRFHALCSNFSVTSAGCLLRSVWAMKTGHKAGMPDISAPEGLPIRPKARRPKINSSTFCSTVCTKIMCDATTMNFVLNHICDWIAMHICHRVLQFGQQKRRKPFPCAPARQDVFFPCCLSLSAFLRALFLISTCMFLFMPSSKLLIGPKIYVMPQVTSA